MRRKLPSLVGAFMFLVACGASQGEAPAAKSGQTATAIFAGGCFWCTESDFEKVRGVVAAESGYIGGRVANPSYDQVSSGGTGHAEAVKVTYDPKQVSYEKLLDVFWHSVDPTMPNAQFCDHGEQYRSAIFYLGEKQHKAAEASRKAIEQSGVLKKPVVTEITQAGVFFPAEEYHQDYYKKNPVRYKFYRNGCGRDKRLEEVWGKKEK